MASHYLEILNGARAVTSVLLGVLTPTEPQPGNLSWAATAESVSVEPVQAAPRVTIPTTAQHQQPR